MASVTLPGVYRLTYADWLRLADDHRVCELIEGELFVNPPPAIVHQRVSRELAYLLIEHLRRIGCGEVLCAPTGVRLSDEDVLEPDLVVVLTEHADRIGTQVIEGAPDLVVEILSPGNARRDLGLKRQKYQAGGVSEYWVVDPESRSIEVLALRGTQYERHGLFRLGQSLTSRVLPDLVLELDLVFPR